MTEVKFEDLKGKTIFNISGAIGDEEMVFETDDGKYKLYHDQD